MCRDNSPNRVCGRDLATIINATGPHTRIPWCSWSNRKLYQCLSMFRLSPSNFKVACVSSHTRGETEGRRVFDLILEALNLRHPANPQFHPVVDAKLSSHIDALFKALDRKDVVVLYTDARGKRACYWPPYARSWQRPDWDDGWGGTVAGLTAVDGVDRRRELERIKAGNALGAWWAMEQELWDEEGLERGLGLVDGVASVEERRQGTRVAATGISTIPTASANANVRGHVRRRSDSVSSSSVVSTTATSEARFEAELLAAGLDLLPQVRTSGGGDVQAPMCHNPVVSVPRVSLAPVCTRPLQTPSPQNRMHQQQQPPLQPQPERPMMPMQGASDAEGRKRPAYGQGTSPSAARRLRKRLRKEFEIRG
jgi:hypothetical protein